MDGVEKLLVEIPILRKYKIRVWKLARQIDYL